MWCNQIFSLLSKQDNNYKIENIIVADNYEIASQLARLQYGESAIAVDTTRYPLKIGDIYEDGIFYSAETGNEVNANPTEQEAIKELKKENEESVEHEAELLYELSLLKLGIEY